LSNLAFSYVKANKLDEAITRGEEALKHFEQTPKQWTDSYTTSLNNLGQYYEEIGQVEKTITLQVKVLSIIKKQ
jgi:tetratricopeptide (TPR) repeat protein